MEDFFYHLPVLRREVLELLKPKQNLLILDATCGGGGHTEAFLRSGADVLALDQDPDAVQHISERLAHFGRRIIVRQANFRHADRVLQELGIGSIGGALLDLGVSSRQLENAERGFSFIRNGPLDMRMDPRTSLTAATIVNEYSEEELTRLFRELGEEPAARRIATLLVKMRKTSPFRETLPLARTIEKLVGRRGRQHPATQVFQALRMEVNDELGALEQGLRVLTARLEPGGRIAVITFHSLEDRIVKQGFARLATGCICPPLSSHRLCTRWKMTSLNDRSTRLKVNSSLSAVSILLNRVPGGHPHRSEWSCRA